METLLTADAGPVRVLTPNDGLSVQMELAGAIGTAMADGSVRAIVLTGAQRSFCAGGDLSTMRGQEATQRVVRAIVDGPKPVVAAVEGIAVGAGLGIALACDRVVAASDARLVSSFTSVGLVGDLGIFWSLPRRVGGRRMLLQAGEVTGADALPMGLVDRVVDPGEALAAAVDDAARFAAGPPLALAAVKAMRNHGPDTADRARGHRFTSATPEGSRSQVAAVTPSARSSYFRTRPTGFFGSSARNST